MEILSYSNKIIFFFDTSNQIPLCIQKIKNFLEIRGIYFSNNFVVSSIYEGSSFFSWDILKSKYLCPYINLSKDSIKKYKLVLKTIVKSSYNKSVILLVKLLNIEIQNWVKLHIFSSNWKNLAIELDLYIYKIIWKYVRRCHPRRTNTWIYSKYWKQFSGVWKFFVIDSVKNKIFFLKSHILVGVNTQKVSSSLNAFNLYNSRKILYSLSKKSGSFFSFSFDLLYRKQKGLCTICKKSIWSKRCKLLKYSSNKESFDLFKDFSLIHIYCKYQY